MTKKPRYSMQFLSGEVLSAEKEFDCLYDENLEAPQEYLERKRKRDMQKLILFIMENELDETRKTIFRRVFFDGVKIADVAKEMGICTSNAYKHYEKALKRMEENLRYVVFYQNSCRNDKLLPLEVMKQNAITSKSQTSLPVISMRISRLMAKNNITINNLCRCTGINRKRFESIFRGETQLAADEITSLSGFFGVTTDYILKGDLS
ncbi:MAG: transcriptional regulator [Clostridia bacterium]|nr:transcriptional regulator [Clostridia bacterium]